jgi:hypothetical protein
MYQTNISNSYFMADDYGQFFIIDDPNAKITSKHIKIIDKIHNRSSTVLISQIDDKIIQANDFVNDIYSTTSTSLCICGLCMLMFTVYHIPIFPILF